MMAIEAVATNIPIVSTDVGGMKDIVRENGFLVPVGNKELYVSRMIDVLEGDFRFSNEIQSEILSPFSSEHMGSCYDDIYR